MNTLTKIASIPLAALALALPATAPAIAGDKSDDIVVTSKAAMKEWQKATTADLNRAAKRAPMPTSARLNAAVVQVAFGMDANGKATNIKVLKGDGNAVARRVAVYAVKQLDTLDQVPVADGRNAQFLARMVFAGSEREHKQLMARLETTDRARFAAADTEGEYILLGG